MKRPKVPTALVILHNAGSTTRDENTQVASFDELLHWINTRRILRLPLAFSRVTFHTQRLDTLIRPCLISLILRFLARGECRIVDESGGIKRVTLAGIAMDGARLARDYLGGFGARARARRRLGELEADASPADPRSWKRRQAPLYLRTDLWFGVKAGGSVTHITGVLNNLGQFLERPVFFSSDTIPLVDPTIEQHIVRPPRRGWDFPELPALLYNDEVIAAVDSHLRAKGASFIYQRYSLNNFAGARLARRHRLPFVLEYNGSEIWINRHWGRPLRHEALATRIEVANLRAADLVVVVSEAMKEELTRRGVQPKKILVNPNGVDERRYHPGIDAGELRMRLGLQDKTVIGFIGTFGAWHGTDVLLEAYVSLLQGHPDLKESTRLLMIGDGALMPVLKQRAAESGVMESIIFTGLVPQEQGPEYLSLCDILAAPTLPNPDGTPFFGSPTKLFEYMAMGKAIVASDLDQIGQVLAHERSALLVEPGKAEALAQAMARLVSSQALRDTLGAEARQEACARYTWRMHTRRILDGLDQRLCESTERGTTCC